MGAVESCLACDSKRSGENDPMAQRTEIKRGTTDHFKRGPNVRTLSPRSSASTAVSSTSDGLAKVGIGAYFQRSKDDSNILLVKSVLKGSPSYATGMVKVGDEVVSVDGCDCYGFSLAELAEKLLGHPGTEVVCGFKSCETGKQYTVTIVRGINARSI